MQSLVQTSPNDGHIFFHTNAMLPQNNDLLKGYETMGEKGGRKTEEIDVSR